MNDVFAGISAISIPFSVENDGVADDDTQTTRSDTTRNVANDLILSCFGIFCNFCKKDCKKRR